MSKLAILLAGLNYGDEGKGTTVDFLAREYNAHLVVRYNGGAQAAHNVVTDEGLHHCFAQFGSGTLIPGTKTYLSKFVLVNPINLHNEQEGLKALGITDAYERLYIDEQAVIITPYHRFLNHVQEIGRGVKPHGSCGQGIWETYKHARDHADEAIRAGELNRTGRLFAKLNQLRARVIAEMEILIPQIHAGQDEAEDYLAMARDEKLVFQIIADMRQDIEKLQIVPQTKLAQLLSSGTVIFEGAQGVLLDAWHGFYPYVTGTDTTFRNAEQLLHECGYDGSVMKLGILRAYMTRHGAGPFVSEDRELAKLIPDLHNAAGRWQGNFRIGWFDLVATKYALKLTGPLNGLVITGLDRLSKVAEIKTCTMYLPNFVVPAVTELPLEPGMTRDDQEYWSLVMMTAEPVYKTFEGGTEQYAQYLAGELGVPLFITSAGTTASAKTLYPLSKKAGFFLTAPKNLDTMCI